jgi:hypothetical protein
MLIAQRNSGPSEATILIYSIQLLLKSWRHVGQSVFLLSFASSGPLPGNTPYEHSTPTIPSIWNHINLLLRSQRSYLFWETGILHYSWATSTHHSIIHLRTFRAITTNPVDYILMYRTIAKQWLSKHITAEAYTLITSIARQRVSKQTFSTIEWLRFLRGPCRGIIKGQRSSSEWVVENWVEFWKLQSKVIEKKWHEMN